MLTAFDARSNIRGQRIDLDISWVDSSARPNLRLLRRTRSPSLDVNDGLLLIDFQEIFNNTDNSWAGQTRELLLGPNTTTESNQQLAEFSQYFTSATKPRKLADSTPYRIVIAYYDGDNYHTQIEIISKLI